jgi:hypothetical protein
MITENITKQKLNWNDMYAEYIEYSNKLKAENSPDIKLNKFLAKFFKPNNNESWDHIHRLYVADVVHNTYMHRPHISFATWLKTKYDIFEKL